MSDAAEDQIHTSKLSERLSTQASKPRQLSRGDLLEALRRIGNREVIPVLSEIAKDPSDPLCCDAARLIFDMGDPAGAELLFELALVGNDEKRYEAAVDLGECGDARAAPFLLPLLDNDTGRLAPQKHWGTQADRRAVPALVNLLSESDNPGLHSAVIDALGLIGDRVATEPLFAASSQCKKG